LISVGDLQKAIEIMKDRIASSPTLGCFQSSAKTVVVADASPTGFAHIIDAGSR
jgi:hypothetical protein